MNDVDTSIISHQSKFDSTHFNGPIDCALYDLTYKERNFKIDNSKLKIFNAQTWEHFKYEFLNHYLVANKPGNGGYNSKPISREFFKNVNSMEDVKLLIETAIRNTFSIGPRINAYETVCQPINKYDEFINDCSNGFLSLVQFDFDRTESFVYRLRSYTDTIYKNFPYEYTIHPEGAMFMFGDGITGNNYLPPKREYSEYINLIYNGKVFTNGEYLTEHFEHAVKILDIKAAKILSEYNLQLNLNKILIEILNKYIFEEYDPSYIKFCKWFLKRFDVCNVVFTSEELHDWIPISEKEQIKFFKKIGLNPNVSTQLIDYSDKWFLKRF